MGSSHSRIGRRMRLLYLTQPRARLVTVIEPTFEPTFTFQHPNMAATVELWMPLDDAYQHALSIPVQMCQRFSLHPLSWLRYVAFTIYGAEGHISRSPTGRVVLYSAVNIQAGDYYYIPDTGGKSYFGVQGSLHAQCSFNVRSISA
jgi:hypothetical protein